MWHVKLSQRGLKKRLSLPPLSDTLLTPEGWQRERLELDEMWSYVKNKTQKRWIWLGLCRRTRQVVAYAVGDRSEKTGRKVWQRVCELPGKSSRYRNAHLYNDAHDVYKLFLPKALHRLSRRRGKTNHLERLHLTLRHKLARLTRKTLAFSKCDQMHETMLLLVLHDHNKRCAENFKTQRHTTT